MKRPKLNKHKISIYVYLFNTCLGLINLILELKKLNLNEDTLWILGFLIFFIIINTLALAFLFIPKPGPLK